MCSVRMCNGYLGTHINFAVFLSANKHGEKLCHTDKVGDNDDGVANRLEPISVSSSIAKAA